MELPKRKSTEVLREHMNIEGTSVLDVGCGRGNLVSWLNHHGADAIGLDPQAYLLSPPAVAGVGDSLPFKSKCVDVVIFFNSLHHVPVAAMQLALSEAARVSRELVIAIEPIAEGSHFLAVQPIDDETEIRAKAYQALHECNVLDMQAEASWQLDYIEADLAALIEGMIRVDPARRATIATKREELERLFYQHGRKVETGYAFDQPMRLNRLRPT